MKHLFFSLYVFFHMTLCGCAKDKRRSDVLEVRSAYQIEQIGNMKGRVPESSGLEHSLDGNLWTLADGGNGSRLYKVSKDGRLLETRHLKGLRNWDWESLASDSMGNLYIGDFGNNFNKRQNLRILKLRGEDTVGVTEIQFRYPDQEAFPPRKKGRTFDCEAFFWHRGYLYLFSKNRGPSNVVKMYRLPDQPGTYVAELMGEKELKAQITGADVSPDGKRVVLLGYGMAYILEADHSGNFFKGPGYCLPIANTGQAEGVLFTGNHDFLFTNEYGKIFQARLRKPL